MRKMSIPSQVGNAVPPPMARYIGLEIKKCLVAKAAEMKNEGVEETKTGRERFSISAKTLFLPPVWQL